MNVENALKKLGGYPDESISEEVWSKLETTLTQKRANAEITATMFKRLFSSKLRIVYGVAAVFTLFTINYTSTLMMNKEVNSYMSSFSQSMHSSTSYYDNSNYAVGNFLKD